MSLYDPERAPQVPPEDAVAVAHDFVRRMQAWADEREIPKLLARLNADPTAADAAKLHQWTTWREFTAYALHELESGKLDPWFEPGDP